MLSTDAFNYVNVLDKAADASWSRENILTNNIAMFSAMISVRNRSAVMPDALILNA